MSLKDKITKIAQEAALGAINYSSSVIQDQLQQQQSKVGIMEILNITQNNDGSTTLQVDAGGSIQDVTYIGSDQIFIGKRIFVDSGYAQ